MSRTAAPSGDQPRALTPPKQSLGPGGLFTPHTASSTAQQQTTATDISLTLVAGSFAENPLYVDSLDEVRATLASQQAYSERSFLVGSGLTNSWDALYELSDKVGAVAERDGNVLIVRKHGEAHDEARHQLCEELKAALDALSFGSSSLMRMETTIKVSSRKELRPDAFFRPNGGASYVKTPHTGLVEVTWGQSEKKLTSQVKDLFGAFPSAAFILAFVLPYDTVLYQKSEPRLPFQLRLYDRSEPASPSSITIDWPLSPLALPPPLIIPLPFFTSLQHAQVIEPALTREDFLTKVVELPAARVRNLVESISMHCLQDRGHPRGTSSSVFGSGAGMLAHASGEEGEVAAAEEEKDEEAEVGEGQTEQPQFAKPAPDDDDEEPASKRPRLSAGPLLS
ncbi:hypothetical protein JCM10207_005939 [Rhodosporidiobolus poonsookiae]